MANPSDPSGTKPTAHRRAISLNDPQNSFPPPLGGSNTHHRLQQQQQHGLTPSYELSDPLSSQSIEAPVSRHRLGHQHQPSSMYKLPTASEEAEQSISPRSSPRMMNSSSSGSGSGSNARFRDSSHGPRLHHTLDSEPSSSSRVHYEQSTSSSKGAISPRMTTASQRPLSPPSSSSRTTDSRSPVLRDGGEGLSRQGSLHRAAAAAQGLFERVASPTFLLKSPSRPDSRFSHQVEETSSDDEAQKGHARDHALIQRRSIAGGNYSHRWTPSLRNKGGEATPVVRSASRPGFTERTSSDQSIEGGDGRSTPACYRPAKGVKTPVKSASTDPSWPSPHHAIAVDVQGHGATTSDKSPLVVPQARRGGLNLMPGQSSRGGGGKRSKRGKRYKRRSNGPSRPSRACLPATLDLLSSTLWHLSHPIHSIRVVITTIQDHVRYTDKCFRDPVTDERVWWPEWLEAYIPLLIWLVISLTSTITVLIFHTQVFKALDELSQTLQRLGLKGRLILGSLIFLTTFPPLPLYSTLIILCGFSFGLWQGFLISYIAALSGAIVVYLLSKSLLRNWMSGLLAKSGSLKQVVRAIEKRPKLLFLIRLAPYPYNLMNTLLASSPSLDFKTYFWCTALALPKLLVHCGLGTSIKNFAAYHGATSHDEGATNDEDHHSTAETVKRVAGFVGVGLCIGIFIYLLRVARQAVRDELMEESDGSERTSDERSAGEYDVLELEEEEFSDEEGEGEDGSSSDEDLEEEEEKEEMDRSQDTTETSQFLPPVTSRYTNGTGGGADLWTQHPTIANPYSDQDSQMLLKGGLCLDSDTIQPAPTRFDSPPPLIMQQKESIGEGRLSSGEEAIALMEEEAERTCSRQGS